MFAKKILPVVGITIAGTLMFTGCTANTGTNTNTPTVAPSPVTEGATAAESFDTVYKASIAKADKEGYVATSTTGDVKTEFIYSPEVSKTEVIAYSQEYGSRLPAEMAPGLNAFIGISTGELEQVQVNGEKNGTYKFVFKDNTNYEVSVSTANGLITGMIITIDGAVNSNVTISYGLSKTQMETAQKWYKETANSVQVDTNTIQEVGQG